MCSIDFEQFDKSTQLPITGVCSGFSAVSSALENSFSGASLITGMANTQICGDQKICWYEFCDFNESLDLRERPARSTTNAWQIRRSEIYSLWRLAKPTLTSKVILPWRVLYNGKERFLWPSWLCISIIT